MPASLIETLAVGAAKRAIDGNAKMEPHFFQDASNRLTHDRADIASESYPEVCRKIADHFDLKPSSELVVGLDVMIGDFTKGESTIELAWDVWLRFTVTAKAPVAEPLVRKIATFLLETLPPQEGDSAH